MPANMSLLQDVLKANLEDIEGGLTNGKPRSSLLDEKAEDSDDDLINVVSLPTSPSRTRASSPVRGASSRPIKGPLILASNKREPLKAFPTELSQNIFSRLSISDMANCALVCKKWGRSQTLNYVWFRHYRKENFHDDSLPPGKWTKRESKQNWRQVYLKSMKDRSPPSTAYSRLGSGYNTPSSNNNNNNSRGRMSGYQTPREIKEEQWRTEAEATKPGKLEMREMYKELGGRKAKAKMKLGSSGTRDKGGWASVANDEWEV